MNFRNSATFPLFCFLMCRSEAISQINKIIPKRNTYLHIHGCILVEGKICMSSNTVYVYVSMCLYSGCTVCTSTVDVYTYLWIPLGSRLWIRLTPEISDITRHVYVRLGEAVWGRKNRAETLDYVCLNIPAKLNNDMILVPLHRLFCSHHILALLLTVGRKKSATS
jgi:hypothetical protein